MVVIAVAASIWMNGGNASAHEVREVGDNTFIVGFAVEPAFLYTPNSIDLIIQDADENGIEGLEDTLNATVSFGGEAATRDLPLEPAYGETGVYHSWFIPTEAGAYTFHITGTIDGEDIDESFTSSPEGFDEVQDLASNQFPTQVKGNAELEAAIADSSGGSSDDADTALIVAIIGVIIGVVGLGTAGVAIMRRGS
jgi:hypothetical protein